MEPRSGRKHRKAAEGPPAESPGMQSVALLARLLFDMPTALVIGVSDEGECWMSASAAVLLGEDAGQPSMEAVDSCLPTGVALEMDGARQPLADWVAEALVKEMRSRQFSGRLLRADSTARDVLLTFYSVGARSEPAAGLWALAIEDLSAGRIVSEQAESAARQQAAIASLGLRALTEPNLPRLHDRVCRMARRVLDVDRVELWSLSEDDPPVARLVAGDGWRRGPVGRLARPVEGSPLARLIRTRKSLVVRDDGGQSAAWGLDGGRPVRVSLSAPIVADGAVRGALCAYQVEDRSFTEDDANFLTALSTVVAGAEARQRYERELVARSEALSRAREEVQAERTERLIELGALTGAVAHQVNNAINSIQMNADLGLLLLERAAEGATVQESLDRIRADCARCAAVVREVLALSRHGPESPSERVELTACLQDALGMLRRSSAPTPELLAEAGLNGMAVCGRRLELGLAFANLARARGEVGATRVEVRARPGTDEHVRIEVEDDGPAPEHAGLPRLFDTLVPGRHGSGGLSLGLVHRIISDHSGTIAAEVAESGGCRFVIELPAAGNLD